MKTISLFFKDNTNVIYNIRTKLEKSASWLLFLGVFFIPLNISATNTLCVLAFVFFLLSVPSRDRLSPLKTNPVALLSLCYIAWLGIGLLWTQDLSWGWTIVRKSRRIMFLPFFICLMKKEHLGPVITSYLTGCTIAMLVSFAVFFSIIPEFDRAVVSDPCVFTSHIFYTPLMAWGTYCALAFARFRPDLKPAIRIGLVCLSLLILTNLFLTKGVAGYAAIFVLLGVFAVQSTKLNIKYVTLITIFLALLFGTMLTFNTGFRDRICQNMNEIRTFDDKSLESENSSIGPRLIMWKNCLTLIKSNPIMGVGTGDLPSAYEPLQSMAEYERFHEPIKNPHSHYFFVLTQSGIIGLVLCLAPFILSIMKSGSLTNPHRSFLQAFSVFLLVIMIGDIYLNTSRMGSLYAIFGSVLFQDLHWKRRIKDKTIG